MSIDFLPDDVELSVPPLVGTMGHAECEHAAMLIVRGCQAHGNKWQAIEPLQIGALLRADIDAKRDPLYSLNRNPFFRPDVDKLVALGFARWTEPEKARKSPVELTEAGLAALRRWVRLKGETVTHRE